MKTFLAVIIILIASSASAQFPRMGWSRDRVDRTLHGRFVQSDTAYYPGGAIRAVEYVPVGYRGHEGLLIVGYSEQDTVTRAVWVHGNLAKMEGFDKLVSRAGAVASRAATLRSDLTLADYSDMLKEVSDSLGECRVVNHKSERMAEWFIGNEEVRVAYLSGALVYQALPRSQPERVQPQKTGPLLVSSLVFAAHVGAGATPLDPATRFKPFDTIWAVPTFRGLSGNDTVTFTFFQEPAHRTLQVLQHVVTAQGSAIIPGYVYNGGGWMPGNYSVEIVVNGEVKKRGKYKVVR